MVVSGEQITMRSTWVSNRGESPPQTKVTLKQLFDPPSRGGRAAGQTGQRPEAGTPGGGVRGEAEGGCKRKEEKERRHSRSRTFTRGEEKQHITGKLMGASFDGVGCVLIV